MIWNSILFIYKIWIIIFKLSIIIFFISLLSHLIGKKSFLSDIIKDIIIIKNKKMILLITIIIISIITYPIIILPSIVYFTFLTITIISSLPLKSKIYPKEKIWRTENYGETDIKIINLIKIIINDFLINSHNKKFMTIYKIFFKNKKDYKEITNNVAFRKTIGFPKTFAESIITFCKKYDNSRINKVWYLKIKIKLKRILWAILRTININFIEEDFKNDIKIIIENFKIKVNGFNDLIKKLSSNAKNNCFKGEIYDLKYPKKEPHIVIELDNRKYSLTTSKKVKAWNDNTWVETIECGKTNKEKTQYALPYSEGKGYENRYLLKENLSKKIIERFEIDNKNKFIGRQFQYSIMIQNKDIFKEIEKAELTKEKNIFKERNLYTKEEELVILINTDHDKIGEEVLNNCSIEEKFYMQKEYYNKIQETKKEKNYYDKDKIEL